MTKQAALVITELHHPCQRTDLCFGWRLKLAWHRAQEIVLAKAWALQLLTQTPFATSWGKKGYRQFHLDCWSLPPVEALMQPYISGWAANPWKRANLLLQFDAKMPIDQAMSQMFHPTQNLTVAGVSTRKWAIRRGSSLSIYLEFYHPISLQFSANVHPSLTTISPIFHKYNFVFAMHDDNNRQYRRLVIKVALAQRQRSKLQGACRRSPRRFNTACRKVILSANICFNNILMLH